MKVAIAKQEMEIGSKYLGTLRESNDVLHEPAELQARMTEDGYLLLRGLHDRARVQAVRDLILDKLAENDQIDTAHPVGEGIVKAGTQDKIG